VAKSAPSRRKKYFTPAEANGTLPLVRAIVRDITELARDLRDRQERLTKLEHGPKVSLGVVYQEEQEQIQAELERGQDKMRDYEAELNGLGIELKDYYSGLIDFPSLHDGREVYLCWRLGEAEVAYWHELDAGFAGRQRILENAARHERPREATRDT
jgi:hypothetical protein